MWRPEAESDDEFERTRDVWGKNLFGVFVDMLLEQGPYQKITRLKTRTGIDVCDSPAKENGMG